MFGASREIAELLANDLYEQKPTEVTGEGIPSKYRDEVLDVLRSKANQNPTDTRAQRILFRLGDEETIQKQIQIFIENNGVDWFNRRTLIFSSSPAVVEALAPSMFLDEELRYYKSPYPEFEGSWGVSYESPVIIRHLLTKIPEVPAEVVGWAHSLPSTPSQNFRSTMRKWWEQNGEHFESENFDRLRPLVTADAITNIGGTKYSSAAVPSVGETANDNQSLPKGLATSQPGEVEEAPISWATVKWWLWAGGGVGAFVLIVFAALKKSG